MLDPEVVPVKDAVPFTELFGSLFDKYWRQFYETHKPEFEEFLRTNNLTDEKQDDQSDTQKDNTNQETSEPPQEQKITKEEAIEKSKDQENLTTIISVDEKEDKGNSYYVVEGERENDKSQNETVFVWVNQDTGAIEKIQRPSAFDSLISWIVKFFLWIIDLVKGFFSWIGSLFEK